MSVSTPVLIEVERPQARLESFYRPGLDILRALAFLLVFVSHGLLWHLDKPTQLGAIGRAGEFGVCIFFFLSSYLITELLLREKRETGTILIGSFYVRRILRIWPLYFAMIGLGWCIGLFSPSHTLSLAWTAALLLLFTNWYTAAHGYPPGFLFPLWSISLEEQFYLLWSLLVKYLSPGSLVGVSSLLMATAYLTLFRLLAQGHSLDPTIWVNSLVQFQFFALGTTTAVVLRGRVPRLSSSARWGLLIAGLLCLRAAQAAVYSEDRGLPHDFIHVAPRYMIALPGCLCLFFSLLPMSAGKRQQPFIYLGKISYGLYVFHVMWLGLFRDLIARVVGDRLPPLACQSLVMALALPATVGTGILSYRYLESPFLRFKKRFTVVRSRPL